ncbi:hypothetical protein EDD11_005919 [Mortierella claussenii]|nr:hypothetical protein EDD11_005919 [Mortierella claussenii]
MGDYLSNRTNSNGNHRTSPILPLQKVSTPSRNTSSAGAFTLPYKRTVFFFVAISSVLVLFNSVHIQLLSSSSSSSPTSPTTIDQTPNILHTSPEGATKGGELHHGYEQHIQHSKTEPEYIPPYADDDNDLDNITDKDDDSWSSADDQDAAEEDEDVENAPSGSPTRDRQRQRRPPMRAPVKAPEGTVPEHCPNLVLTTETSFEMPSYTSSSTVPNDGLSSSPLTTSSLLSSAALTPDQVHCQKIPSQLKDYLLAFCVSNTDCARGFIQIVHDVIAPLDRLKVSKDYSHDQHFRQVAGPDDFYFLMEGSQKLALGAHLVSNDLWVDLDGRGNTPSASPDMDGTTTSATAAAQRLVYRADFRMALPGPVQLAGWLTYERFRAVRENRPGTWPQWTHAVLIDPKTKVDSNDNNDDVENLSTTGTKFNVCPNCELDSFLDQVKSYREQHFQQCDRMSPVRGSYWREGLALKVFSDLDIVNRAPGAGAFLEMAVVDLEKTEKQEMAQNKLTRGWRFVPNGCTMTSTSSLPNAASQDPFLPTCDSIASPAGVMRALRFRENPVSDNDKNNSHENNDDNYPRRRILFTGDSQVRTTYNAILNHYRPIEVKYQRFGSHDEFLHGLDDLNLNNTVSDHPTAAILIPRTETDTELELVYRADQFLAYLVASTDQELDRFDTIYLNIGQWPASGPAAGGQWSTAQLLERWEAVIERLNRWKASRKRHIEARSLYSPKNDDDVAASKLNPTMGSGDASIVIWAGMNAFPMRTDAPIRLKGDWRTNARLGYWDDWIEAISQEAGGWFRRMNSWQLTFPMLDQVVDKAHFQETDAIDALKVEALYKLDLCSRMRPDLPYSSPLSETITAMEASA